MAAYYTPPVPKAPGGPAAKGPNPWDAWADSQAGKPAPKGPGPGWTPPVPPAPGAAAVPGAHPAAPLSSIPGNETYHAPAPPAPPPAPNPYDSTYYQKLGDATLAANQKINQYTLQNSYGNIDLQNTLNNDQYNNTLAIQRAQNAENARGGFALGALGETMGNINRSSLNLEAGATNTNERNQAMREAAIAGARSNLSTEQIALGIAAADRSAQAAAKNPAVGGVVPPAAPALPPLSPGGIRAASGHTAPPAVRGYTVRGLGGGNWEYVPVGAPKSATPSRGAPKGTPGGGSIRWRAAIPGFTPAGVRWGP